ncbi:MAG: serine/threonine-protein kinase [Rhodothermales bacterium]
MPQTRRTHVAGEYKVLAQLGEGGMAEVFKAQHLELSRIVALKLLPYRFLANEEIRTRFKREARAGAQLEHDHIVTTYDFGIYEGQPFIAVAFIEGEALTRRIRTQGRLSPEKTVRLIAPIAEALAYAHRKGVIHRDIKSSNIMIRAEDERPILIDFGIAQASFMNKLTERGHMLGTPAYMSPEQAAAQEIGHHSDLYSLGVVLYECLTGTVPFQSPDTEVLLANIKHEPHRPVRERVPEVPQWLSDVVDRCLAKKPEDRHPNGDVLAAALRSGLADNTVALARPEEPASPSTAPPSEATEAVIPALASRDEASAKVKAPDSGASEHGKRARGPKRSSITIWVGGVLIGSLLALGGGGYLAGWFDVHDPPAEEQDEGFAGNTELEEGNDDTSTPDSAIVPVEEDTVVTPPPPPVDPTPPPPSVADLMRQAEAALSAENYTEALALFHQAAERGSAEAKLQLGKLYGTGQGVPQNFVEAATWMLQAAEQGNAEAQFLLGLMYKNRRGALQSDTEAVRWLRAAADQGYAMAQYNLGLMYREGRGVEKNDEEALQWYLKAAEQGHANAQFNAGRMYWRGEGTTRNDEQALRWYRKAAEQGHTRAQRALRRMSGN